LADDKLLMQSIGNRGPLEFGHSPELTRQAKSVVFLVCQRLRSSADGSILVGLLLSGYHSWLLDAGVFVMSRLELLMSHSLAALTFTL